MLILIERKKNYCFSLCERFELELITLFFCSVSNFINSEIDWRMQQFPPLTMSQIKFDINMVLKIRAKFLMRCKLTDHVAASSFDTTSLIEITWDLANKKLHSNQKSFSLWSKSCGLNLVKIFNILQAFWFIDHNMYVLCRLF